jgi:hypothetical protein
MIAFNQFYHFFSSINNFINLDVTQCTNRTLSSSIVTATRAKHRFLAKETDPCEFWVEGERAEEIVNNDILPAQTGTADPGREDRADNELGPFLKSPPLLHRMCAPIQNHVNEMEKELASTKKSLSSFVIKARTK